MKLTFIFIDWDHLSKFLFSYFFEPYYYIAQFFWIKNFYHPILSIIQAWLNQTNTRTDNISY